MDIAVIGAGLAGLATAFYLLKEGRGLNLCLYDAEGVGGGASGIAAGLVHPFSGAHARMNWRGEEAMGELKALFRSLGFAPPSGLLRPALSSEQERDFKLTSKRHRGVSWVERCDLLVEGAPSCPGLFIEEGFTVEMKAYLHKLQSACEELGAQLKKRRISSLKELERFDRLFLAPGSGALQFEELGFLRLRPVKGQLLQMEWPKGLPPLAYPLNSKAYLVMDRSQESCWVGSTFEKSFASPLPDPEEAKKRLLPKALSLYPPLSSSQILGCKAALRMASPDHLPKWGALDRRTWYLVGLGSKGLLYHALAAKELVSSFYSSI